MSFLSQSPKRGQMPFKIVSPETGAILTVDPNYGDRAPGISGTWDGQQSEALISFVNNRVRLDGDRPQTSPINGSRKDLAVIDETMAGHTWQYLTGSRSNLTTYQNTTGRPIIILLEVSRQSAAKIDVSVDNGPLMTIARGNNSGSTCNAIGQITIQPTQYYYADITGSLQDWWEFKP